ncbi:hypothetical protein ABZY44_01605 [Streptomyces sp. NPDC006544]|uniref:hypothetical protein n=1 Tax=Streptomyces sp. NPDC006544 TaxID=3154583 RepID=UPI0033A13B42
MIDIAASPAPGTDIRASHRAGAGPARKAAVTAAEAATSVIAALLLTALAWRLRVDPVERIGQVSGLAAIQLRLLFLLAATVLLYAFFARMWPGAAVRLASAAVAGLATGVIAAGNVVALSGTDWPMYANWADAGNLQQWAFNIIDGVALPKEYPPGFPHLLASTAQLFFDGDVPKAMKWLMIGFAAIAGPAAYLAWRLLLPPLWALGVGVTSTLPLMDLYKPYSALVLIVVIPVFAKLVDVVQRSAELGRKRATAAGAGLGVLLAAMFLLYSGWFLWSAVGVVVLFALVLVRLARAGGKRALADGLLALGASAAAFLLLAGSYLVNLLATGGSTKDGYFYFDTFSDPAYFAMWGGAFPGRQRVAGWPPLGELGGVQLFSVVLVIGLGVALTLGLRRPAVLTLAACTGSAFLLRYWYASHMERDGAVQLYPRTSLQITYCLIALTGLAVYLTVQRVRAWSRAHGGAATAGEPRRTAGAAGTPRAMVIGALCASGLLFGMAGSATANAYMPASPGENSNGQLTWTAHNVRLPNGECPKFAEHGKCAPYNPPQRVGKH